MPYFHALAVFEVREFSLEGAERAVAGLLKTLRHPRVLYYEHDTAGGLGPYSSSASALYFPVIVDFDVEAHGEERAADLAEEVLDSLSTDEIQFLAVGLAPGERRVVQKALSEEERESRQEGREERRGKGRRSRGRGRKRDQQQDAESRHEEELAVAPESETASAVPLPELVDEKRQETVTVMRPATAEGETSPSATTIAEMEPPPPPPPRSSSSMRVTLSMTLYASELAPQNGSTLLDQQELVTLALAEAKRRYPELPTDISPESEIVSQPWGETVLTLTWHYDVPVPSAEKEAEHE